MYGLKYRPDIDGLRALAVLAVVCFHGGLGVTGGFTGVDVFFVISGYLITGLILKDLREGTFSMMNFWERRVRRIFPALFVVVLVCLAAGWFLLLPFGYMVLGQSALALAIFASNIQFWRTTDYFSPRAEENPLLHTWSLSVEEQFYLVIPVLLAGLYAWRRHRFLLPVLVLITTGSFFVSIAWVREEPPAAFYLLPSRAWELGAGALVAFASPMRSEIWRMVSASAGLSGMVTSFFLIGPGTPFPGWAAVPAVGGTALVIWSGCLPSGGRILWPHRLLAWGPLVWCGLLSYSLYLWHWPFFAFHCYLVGHVPAVGLSLLYIVAAFALSMLSLRFVEKPFRQKKLCASRQAIFGFFLAGTAIVAAWSLSLYLSSGAPGRLPPEVLRLDRVEGDRGFERGPARQLPGGANVYELGLPGARTEVLLWGDSHADVLLGAVNDVCRELGVGGVAVTTGGKPPLFGWSGLRETTEDHARAVAAGEAVGELLGEKTIRVVVMVFRWSYYVRRDPPLNVSRIPVPGFEDRLVDTIRTVEQSGARVVLFEEVPIFGQHAPRSAALERWLGLPRARLEVEEVRQFRRVYQPVLDRVHAMFPQAILVDPVPLFSDRGTIEFLTEDGVLLWRDEHHLTSTAAGRLKPALRESLSQVLAEP